MKNVIKSIKNLIVAWFAYAIITWLGSLMFGYTFTTAVPWTLTIIDISFSYLVSSGYEVENVLSKIWRAKRDSENVYEVIFKSDLEKSIDKFVNNLFK